MEKPDFDAAEFHLRQAREAYEVGNDGRFRAGRHLVAVALGIELPASSVAAVREFMGASAMAEAS
jgi:hypothetical protein